MTELATDELPLHGGLTNAGRVTRVGDTVRRPLRATSDGTRALLDHLHEVGFDGAPRYLGVDERGREVLTYIPGEAVLPPYPEWALTEEALISVARLMRRYHDAVAGFDPAGHRWPSPVPDRFRTGIISHNDPNLDNVIFRDGRAVALIDFDLAGPGCTEWDLACSARLWAPLRAECDRPAIIRDRALERLATFADAYGATPAQRAGLVDAVVTSHDWCYSVVLGAINAGHEAFGSYWRSGASGVARRTRSWLAAHRREMRAALGVA